MSSKTLLSKTEQQKLLKFEQINMMFDIDFKDGFDDMYNDVDLVRLYSNANLCSARLLNNMVLGIADAESFCDLVSAIDKLEDHLGRGLYGVRGSIDELMTMYDVKLGDCYEEN